MSNMVQRLCTAGAPQLARTTHSAAKTPRREAKSRQGAQHLLQTSSAQGTGGARLLSAEPSQVTGTAEVPMAAPDSSARLRISRRPLLRRAFLPFCCASPAAGSCTQ